jgi:hypothetical protein
MRCRNDAVVVLLMQCGDHPQQQRLGSHMRSAGAAHHYTTKQESLTSETSLAHDQFKPKYAYEASYRDNLVTVH